MYCDSFALSYSAVACVDPEGVRTPPPLKNHKTIVFPSNTGPDPLKITKLPSQHLIQAIIGLPAKCHFNAGSLAGQ